MTKCIPLILYFLSIPFYSQTQNETIKNIGIVKGIVFDSKVKKALAYVNIVCKDNTNTIISGGITNTKGVFLIQQLPLDSIFVDVQFIGYKTIKRTIVLSEIQPIFDILTLFLEEDISQLDEVVIQSETSTIIQKIDRKVIHVGKDLAATGSNALQLLENIPSVQVNFITGNINLRGNSNARVLIDGKPSNLNLLKQIPTFSIKSVELITNPSAKYTPEGMSGIINIILKKNTTVGFNGSVNIGAEHSINTRPVSSLNLNYRAGSINIYANLESTPPSKFEVFALFDRTDKNSTQNINYLDNTTGGSVKTGIDFYINKKNTISCHTSQILYNKDYHVNTNIVEDNKLIFNAPNLSQFKNKEQAYNIDYKIDIDTEGQNIELEINYTRNTDPQNDFNKETVNPSSKVNNYTNKIVNNSDFFLANLDYTKPISGGTLELGMAARIQNTFNNIMTDQELETKNNLEVVLRGNSTFNYDRKIYSGYVNYTKEYKKIAFQGGLRLEYFRVSGLFSNTQKEAIEPYIDKFLTLYPSAYFTYYASDKNQFQIGYSRRVDRPSVEQVSIIPEMNSPLITNIGNRTLQPQFTNSYEVNYTRNSKKVHLSFTAFYRRTTDIIDRIINKDKANENRQLFSYVNYETADNYGVEFSSSFKLTKWWSFRASTQLYIQNNQGLINDKKESIKNTFFSTKISNNFKVFKKLNLHFIGLYLGKKETVQYKIKPYFYLNVSAQLDVLDGNGSVIIGGRDIFNALQYDYLTTKPILQKVQYTFELNCIYLGFSYNFGSGKNRERNRKYRENNETEGKGNIL